MAAIDIFGQNADVLDSPGFREAIERRVDPKRLNELHVENRVDKHRHETVHDRQSEQEFEPRYIPLTQPHQSHFFFFFRFQLRERERERLNHNENTEREQGFFILICSDLNREKGR